MRRLAPPSIHEEDVLGKAYDVRLMARLWRYVRPHRALVALSLLLMLAVSAAQLVQHSAKQRPKARTQEQRRGENTAHGA